MIETGHFALLMLPAMLALISAAFVWKWWQDSERLSAVWFAASFFAIAIGFSGIIIQPGLADAPTSPLALLAPLIGLCCALLGLSLTQSGGVSRGWVCSAILLATAVFGFSRNGFTIDGYTMVVEAVGLLFYAMGLALALEGPQRVADKCLAFFMGAGLLMFAFRFVMFMDGHTEVIVGANLLSSTYFLGLMFFSSICIIGSGLSMLAGEVMTTLERRRDTDLTDPLSGLILRRGFADATNRFLKQGRRIDQPATLILADLDHFRNINDMFGHLAGDSVIAAFGDIVSRTADGQAVSGRVGGEEFALLLTDGDVKAAYKMAQTMRQAFENTSIPAISFQRQTASFGISAIGLGETFEDVYQRADAALREAKAAGRNRIRIQSVDMPGTRPAALVRAA